LILEYFEKPCYSQEVDPLTKQVSSKALYSLQSRGIHRLRLLLDAFFTQYALLGLENARSVFRGSVQAIYFLVRARIEGMQKWDNINFYKVFYKFSSLLHLNHTFDLAGSSQISFQSLYLRALGFLALNKENPLSGDFLSFLMNGTGCLNIKEIAMALKPTDFIDEFVKTLNPLMIMLKEFESK
jgi:hypothetical protein